MTFRHAWLPAGGVSSSIDDMLTYAAALVGGGANQHGRVLRPETLQSMYEPGTWLGDRVPLQGWCFFLGQEGKHRSVYHYGDLFGFESALLAAPDQRITVVVLVNRQSRGGAQRLGIDLLREMLGLPPPPSVDASESHTSPDIAAAVSGDYQAVPPRQDAGMARSCETSNSVPRSEGFPMAVVAHVENQREARYESVQDAKRRSQHSPLQMTRL